MILRPRARAHTKALELGPLPGNLQNVLARGRTSLAEPFLGVTTDGTVVPGLFPLRTTGVSLEPVVAAADSFLAALDSAQQSAALFAIESDAWRAWHNMHPFLMRHGVPLERLDAAGRERALALLRASLSASGFEATRNVMKLNETIAEITGRPEEYGEWYYWLSFFGSPSTKDPWGWQLDGHHLIVNCFVLGDQIVLTPNFMGSEPCVARGGRYAGTCVFEAEEAAGVRLMTALSPAQRERATLGLDLPHDVLGTAFRDNLVLAYEGIPYHDLDPEQRALLLALIETYVGRIRPGHAQVRLDEVKAHLDATWFAWAGRDDDESPFYYRVHSPVILIEFDHQSGIAFDNDEPSRNHIHTLVRTPNGNDYGKDLLRQHYERFDHSHPNTAHRRGLE